MTPPHQPIRELIELYFGLVVEQDMANEDVLVGLLLRVLLLQRDLLEVRLERVGLLGEEEIGN